jgi:hypothetical protein
MPLLPLKLALGADKRFVNGDAARDFSELVSLIIDRFTLPQSTIVAVSFQDDDGDIFYITRDEELEDARSACACAQRKALHLTITLPSLVRAGNPLL